MQSVTFIGHNKYEALGIYSVIVSLPFLPFYRQGHRGSKTLRKLTKDTELEGKQELRLCDSGNMAPLYP